MRYALITWFDSLEYMAPLIVLTTVETGVVSVAELQEYRVMLELPLSEAAKALGLSLDEYAALERHQCFFFDLEQWKKAKALLKQQATSSG